MRKLLLTALVFLTSATAWADGSEWFEGKPSVAVRAAATPEAKARTYLAESAERLRLDGVNIAAPNVLKSSGGTHVVRFEQRYAGLPVLASGAALRVGSDGDVARVMLSVARKLALSPTPSFDAGAAHAALEAYYARALPDAERSTLVVASDNGGTLLWQLDVRDTLGGSRYWVDAHTGAVFGARSLATDAQGRVYLKNSVQTPVPSDVELVDLDVLNPQVLDGWSGLLQVTNYASGSSSGGFTLEQTLNPSSGSDFLYDPPADVHDGTDAFAQVNLYYHLTSMRTFAGTLGVDINVAKWKVTAVANAQDGGQPLDNAFFSEQGQTGAFQAPNLIAIGQGSQNDFAYDSDVFKHEFGHYLTHNAINYNLGQTYSNQYGLSPFSGAIDEGIADYLACSNNGDAIVGEASLAPLGAARDLTNVGKVCPDDLYGEVHDDGELAGSIAWSVRTAFGAALGDALVWGAVTMLPAGATFGDLGRALIASAEAMQTSGQLTVADVQTVTDLVASRGIDNCDQVITLAPGASSHPTALGLTTLGSFFGATCQQLQGFGAKMPALFQFSRQVAAGDTAIRFHVTNANGPAQFTIYARKGSNVVFAPSGGFIPLPEVQTFDQQAAIDGAEGEIVIDAQSPVPFDPTAEYFFAIVNTGCETLAATVTATTDGQGVGGAGGGGSGAGGAAPATPQEPVEVTSCGCRVPGQSDGSGMAAAALALLGLAAYAGRRRSRA